MLMVESVGTILTDGVERPRVVLAGSLNDVREAGNLLGQHVSIAPRAGGVPELTGLAGAAASRRARRAAPEDDGSDASRMAGALLAGLPVQRRYLRSLVELGCRGRDGALEVDADNPPWAHSLDAALRPSVADALIAIREAEAALRRADAFVGCRDDDAPAWLDEVIDGEIEI